MSQRKVGGEIGRRPMYNHALTQSESYKMKEEVVEQTENMENTENVQAAAGPKITVHGRPPIYIVVYQCVKCGDQDRNKLFQDEINNVCPAISCASCKSGGGMQVPQMLQTGQGMRVVVAPTLREELEKLEAEAAEEEVTDEDNLHRTDGGPVDDSDEDDEDEDDDEQDDPDDDE